MVFPILGANTESAAYEISNSLRFNDDSSEYLSKTPSSASDTGKAGQIAWDSDYIYICVATNTWKRAELSTW